MSALPEVPDLPGVLTVEQVRKTAASIARTQEPSGAVPWFPGGQVDVWDHVECAMALSVGGQAEAADRAFDWLFATQRLDGSWPMQTRGGVVEDGGADSNMCAYVAVGTWHHWLLRRDEGFLQRAWPVVRRALDRVVAHQLRFGGIAWAQNELGDVLDTALVAGSSSILQALDSGVALAELVGEARPSWSLAAGRLAHALCRHEDQFAAKRRYSMDWYYPVLAGALTGEEAGRRLSARWADFVVPGLGIRCVDDRPWVTGAETCELALSLARVGQLDQARELVADMQHLRDPDGSYWTGYVYPDDARWPVERSTWTAAAVVLAVDALAGASPGSAIFTAARARPSHPLSGNGDCCMPGAREPSSDGVPGVAAHALQDTQRPQPVGLGEVAALEGA
jgi:hypothetical protein